MIWSVREFGAGWRRSIGDRVWDALPRTWLPEYDRDARDQLNQLLSRVMDAMTVNGTREVAACNKDGLISLTKIDPASLSERGDRRYGSNNLAFFLRQNPSLDLVPMVCGVSQGHPLVLDGHHRMRAYEAAGRQALTFISTVVPGSGMIRLVLPASTVRESDPSPTGDRERRDA